MGGVAGKKGGGGGGWCEAEKNENGFGLKGVGEERGELVEDCLLCD